MAEELLSVGLDVGTTTSQLIFSRLLVENRGSAFTVPELIISSREVIYRSPVRFTPLSGKDRVDEEKLRVWVAEEYAKAGIERGMVDTGAIIITGETSRKENAAAVLEALAGFAGDFVVATAGPDLESVLAARGAGAVAFSAQTGKTVLHMDIGGGTTNLALIRDGKIVKTGCLNVGGRLMKMDENGVVTYVSPVLQGLWNGKVGERAGRQQVEALAQQLVKALEIAAGLKEKDALLEMLWTRESEGRAEPFLLGERAVLSFSGGVADCIENQKNWLDYGDIGPILGQKIWESALCQGKYRLGAETIRATVIGAGSHSVQLSGSTVYWQKTEFPLKNLRAAKSLKNQEEASVLALSGENVQSYRQVAALADQIAESWKEGPVVIALESDLAKALGCALALRMGKDRPILCIDRVRLEDGDYLDVAAPVGSALPVVVKTLVLER